MCICVREIESNREYVCEGVRVCEIKRVREIYIERVVLCYVIAALKFDTHKH